LTRANQIVRRKYYLTHTKSYRVPIKARKWREISPARMLENSRHANCHSLSRRLQMKSEYLRTNIGRALLALSFIVGIGLVSTSAVQAQWPYGRDRDRDYRRDRDNGQYDRYGRNNGGYQIAVNQGYQDGINTGSRDAQRGQNYDPQRSHFYRNGHGGNGNYGGNGRYGNRYEFQQAYRQGFLRGYQEGYRQYGGYRRNNGNNGNYGRRWPW
jgi:hypothetical protein